MVFIRPFSTPKASSRTLIIGTKQLVVHEAFDTTRWAAGSKVSSLTPITNVASAPVAGAEMITRGAPASRCAAALARSVKKPVDSTTTSTPRSPHGSSFGSRSAVILRSLPSTRMPSSVASTVASRRPITESNLSRRAMSLTEPRSLADTISMSAPWDLAARKKLRPMRPNPLMPTRIVIVKLSPWLANAAIRSRRRAACQSGRRPVRSALMEDHGGIDTERAPERVSAKWSPTADRLRWALVAVGALLRLREYAADRSLWRDEASLVHNILHRGWLGFDHPLDFNQGTPPGFFVIEHGVASIFGST